MKIFILTIIITCFALMCSAQYSPKAKGELITHEYFSLDYNESHELANWAYYKLIPKYINGEAERSNKFIMDPKVSSKSANTSDYTKSGYDRGHLCPAADMKHNDIAMKETFYMSNMAPQSPSFNRGGWKKLEELIRDWCITEKEIFVVTGPILNSTKGSIGSNKVSIPNKFYKIIYSEKNKKMIAFIMPNDKITNPLISYSVSVDEIENLTGIDFFYQVEDTLENYLESSINTDLWTF